MLKPIFWQVPFVVKPIFFLILYKPLLVGTPSATRHTLNLYASSSDFSTWLITHQGKISVSEPQEILAFSAALACLSAPSAYGLS